jgi:hypothetical protein
MESSACVAAKEATNTGIVEIGSVVIGCGYQPDTGVDAVNME